MLPNIKNLTRAVKREIEFEWLEKYFCLIGIIACGLATALILWQAGKLADERASAYRSQVEANRLEMVLDVKLSEKWNNVFKNR